MKFHLVEDISSHLYQLVFDLTTSEKWDVSHIEALVAAKKDESFLYFDYVPTQEEVNAKLNELTEALKIEFNKVAKELDVTSTAVFQHFYNIKLYKMDIENYDDDLIQEYDDFKNSFEVVYQ